MDRGDNEIATLMADLEKSDKPTLRRAVDALIRLCVRDPEIGVLLTQFLNDTSRKNRWPIAYVLGNLPLPPQCGVQVLIETLDHQDPDIRWAVALLLIRLANKDGPILRLLVKLAAEGTAQQRRMAIYTLRDVKLNDDERVQTLLHSLHDPDPTVRVAAVTSLKRQSGLNETGKTELLERFLQDNDSRVRDTAAVTLAYLGDPSEQFLNALQKASTSDNAQLKKAATAALSILQNKRSAPHGS